MGKNEAIGTERYEPEMKAIDGLDDDSKDEENIQEIEDNEEIVIVFEDIFCTAAIHQIRMEQSLEEIARLRKELTQEKDTNKQLQSENHELKHELSLKKNKLCDNYKSWSSNNIHAWIMHLENGRFQKYGDKIWQKLKEEEIDGTCLEDMDANDLHRLGITQFKDKKTLIRYIQNLMSQQEQNMNDQSNDDYPQQEGAHNTPHV